MVTHIHDIISQVSLYTRLTTAGIQTRIMGYLKGISNNAYKHAWVQINLGDGRKTGITENITQNTTVHWVAERSCSNRSR